MTQNHDICAVYRTESCKVQKWKFRPQGRASFGWDRWSMIARLNSNKDPSLQRPFSWRLTKVIVQKLLQFCFIDLNWTIRTRFVCEVKISIYELSTPTKTLLLAMTPFPYTTQMSQTAFATLKPWLKAKNVKNSNFFSLFQIVHFEVKRKIWFNRDSK